jgi:hypothetical protein
VTDPRPKLDLDAAMAALEARSCTAPETADGEVVAQAARLPRRTPREAISTRPAAPAPVSRIRSTRTDRVHMFSTHASAETLNALCSLARDERRTVTGLFEEAVGLLVNRRGRAG